MISIPVTIAKRTFTSTTKRLDFAKIAIIGRIGSDLVEHTTNATNKPFLKYSIVSQASKKYQPNWFNVTVFDDNQVKFMEQYVIKGSKVYIEADVTQNKYEKEDGTTGFSFNFVQRQINLLQTPRNATASEDGNNN
ncbi:related to Single-stranded DNA-binding protein RIM1, mitochondrial [Saccharomycodes ludwigii]|uniref:Single-stranded DNA-binding protein n=1 Tax=Saccharomycodes ludwigii TaxID=36035 RepID=A0A376B631_9ASCO|nr:hypothetical protein SCDLUD_003943 [Saccharomycodes ludwigii]KAH3899660.1 hypothetical protein SCDLUD_003943 [Saccharomycodes ludwigii]SSD60133.1 related to Single-stranded DNA-binding protein RIM1, mitochondrial [Saccharomycodes ludwigii]